VVDNGKEATINRALDGSKYPGYKPVHYVFGKINYGGLKYSSFLLGTGTANWWVTEPR
jgi:hypothetical protein